MAKKRRGTWKSGGRKWKKARSTYAPFNMAVGTNPVNSVVYRGIGFPDKLQTNIVYSDSILLDPSASTICPFFSVAMNDCFDPQVSIGGGQPTYFDQLATIYGRYKVIGSKLTAVFSRQSGITAGAGPYISGITCSDQAGLVTTSAADLISVPNTTWKVVNDQDGSQSVAATYSARKTYPNMGDSLQARTNASPSVKWIGNIFSSPQGTDIETPINCVFIIEYCVVFDDLKYIVDT